MAKDVIARLRVEHDKWDKELDAAKKKMNGFSGEVQQGLKDLAKWAASAAAAKVAMEGFKRAIESTQTATDEWGRSMESCTRVVDSFFESLARGSMDSFLGGLDNIIKKARDAYDAIDALGTFDITIGYARQKLQTEAAELKLKIRKGEGDTEGHKKRLREIQEELRAIGAREVEFTKSAARAKLQSYTNNKLDVSVLEKYIEKHAEEMQNVAMHDAQGLKAHFMKLQKTQFSQAQVSKWHSLFGGDLGGGAFVGGMANQSQEKEVWQDEQKRQEYLAVRAFGEMSDEKLQEIMSLYVRSAAVQQMLANGERENLETLNYKTQAAAEAKSSLTLLNEPSQILRHGTTTSMAELERLLAEWKEVMKNATDSVTAGMAEKMVNSLQERIDAQPIALKVGLDEGAVAKVHKEVNTLSEEMMANWKPLERIPGGKMRAPLEEVEEEVSGINDGIMNTVNSFAVMGTAMEKLNDPGTQVAGLVMQAIANVAATFAKSLQGTMTPWDWIAAAISGSATMVSTIAAIKSATAGTYAEGGMVTGGPFAGDAVPIMANAGEVVLSAAQQSNLSAQLQRQDKGGAAGTPYVSGEMIYLGLNNFLKRSGKGEIVVAR